MGNQIVKGLEFTSTEFVEYDDISIDVDIYRRIACHRFKRKGVSKKLEKLFFIHGVGGSSHIWQNQISFFTNLDYEVILIDLFGHGLSSKSKDIEDYEFCKLSKDCLTVFDRFRLESGQNNIVGHSYGCSMATYVAHNRQNLVKRMVLISGGSSSPLGDPEVTFVLSDCCLRCLHPLILPLFRSQAHYGCSSSNYEKKISINVDSLVLKAMIVGQVWDEGGPFYHSQIFVPTLLIHGKRDKFVSIDEETDMQHALPLCNLHTVRKAGHMSMLQASAEVNAAMIAHFHKDWSTVAPNNLSNGDQFLGSCSVIDLSIPEKSQNDAKISPKILMHRKTMPIGLLVRRKSTQLSLKRALSMRSSFQNFENNVSQEITVQETISEEVTSSGFL